MRDAFDFAHMQKPSRRPWRRNPAWPASGHDVSPSPILDADGEPVIGCSDWLYMAEVDISMIIEVVNAYKGPWR